MAIAPTGSPRGWHKLDKPRAIAELAMAASVAMSLVLALAFRHRWSIVRGSFTIDQIERADRLAQNAQLALLGVSLLTLAAIIVWMYRAARNVQLLGRQTMQWSPGWAIGAWFIPVANAVLPFLVVDEVYRASEPDPNADWRQSKRNWAVWGWMGAWVVLVIVRVATGQPDLQGTRADLLVSLRRQWVLALVGTIVYLVATVAAIAAMRTIGQRQQQAVARLPERAPAAPYQWGGAGGYVPPPPPPSTPVAPMQPSGPQFN
jgi:chaperone required for assembly of F1-ATPase